MSPLLPQAAKRPSSLSPSRSTDWIEKAQGSYHVSAKRMVSAQCNLLVFGTYGEGALQGC